MATEVKMPRLSLTMESGTILRWLKATGDTVAKGEGLAELETDKVNVVMEAPAGGVVRRLLVQEGVEVACDTVVAILTATAAEDLDGSPIVDTAAPPAAAPAAAPPTSAPPSAGRAHVHASPAAKNLARNLGIDLATVTGSGPGGRIGLDDVQRAADARVETAAPDLRVGAVAGAAETREPSAARRVPLTRMRAAIARRMTLAATTVPQFTVRRRVDMSGALRWREAQTASTAGSARQPSVADVLHLAVARALHTHPEVNASFEPGPTLESSAIVLHAAVNLGIAVSLPEGLIVPVIHDAHLKGLADLTEERLRLQEQARAGLLAAGSLDGATFTVSNLGTLGVDEFTAIVNPPEAAILAVGRMQHELLVRDGAIHTLPMMALTATADHRVLDGAQVACFLETLAGYLERPETLP